ncbi:hypothetical protein ABK040_006910 [Willaertia magna]
MYKNGHEFLDDLFSSKKENNNNNKPKNNNNTKASNSGKSDNYGNNTVNSAFNDDPRIKAYNTIPIDYNNVDNDYYQYNNYNNNNSRYNNNNSSNYYNDNNNNNYYLYNNNNNNFNNYEDYNNNNYNNMEVEQQLYVQNNNYQQDYIQQQPEEEQYVQKEEENYQQEPEYIQQQQEEVIVEEEINQEENYQSNEQQLECNVQQQQENEINNNEYNNVEYNDNQYYELEGEDPLFTAIQPTISEEVIIEEQEEEQQQYIPTQPEEEYTQQQEEIVVEEINQEENVPYYNNENVIPTTIIQENEEEMMVDEQVIIIPEEEKENFQQEGYQLNEQPIMVEEEEEIQNTIIDVKEGEEEQYIQQPIMIEEEEELIDHTNTTYTTITTSINDDEMDNDQQLNSTIKSSTNVNEMMEITNEIAVTKIKINDFQEKYLNEYLQKQLKKCLQNNNQNNKFNNNEKLENFIEIITKLIFQLISKGKTQSTIVNTLIKNNLLNEKDASLLIYEFYLEMINTSSKTRKELFGFESEEEERRRNEEAERQEKIANEMNNPSVLQKHVAKAEKMVNNLGNVLKNDPLNNGRGVVVSSSSSSGRLLNEVEKEFNDFRVPTKEQFEIYRTYNEQMSDGVVFPYYITSTQFNALTKGMSVSDSNVTGRVDFIVLDGMESLIMEDLDYATTGNRVTPSPSTGQDYYNEMEDNSSKRSYEKNDRNRNNKKQKPESVMSSSSTSSSTIANGVNIQVLLRCRPANDKEKGSPLSIEISSLNKREVRVHQKLVHGKEVTKLFTFDRVYGASTTQKELFDESIKHIVDETLDGFNCTIFAYGQTSSGKTFTMEGRRDEATSEIIDNQAGVIPRSVYHIFETLERNKTEYTIKVSCMELYNEELQDLLTDRQNKLKIFEDSTGRKGTVVSGLEEITVRDSSQIMSILDDAQKRRQIAETNMNKASSRSHCITTITIHMKEVNDEGEELIKTGKLNLVDLAGSENIQRSGAVKLRAKEAGMINQSLLTLGRVITALTEHSPHVPYRESKLTRILQDSLGGRTKTCLIATISPSVLCFEETMSTLDYAHKAKSIKNKPEVNLRISKAALIKEMAADMEKLKAELNSQRLKNGVFLPPEQYEEQVKKLEEQEGTIRELEDQVQLKMKEYEELNELFKVRDKELQNEMASHTETKQSLETTKMNLEETKNSLSVVKRELDETNFVLTKHQETEEELHTEAHGLLHGLRESMDDIEGFVKKVERKSKVEAENHSLVERFKDSLRKKVIGAEEDVESVVGLFNGLHQTAKTSVEEFLTDKTTHFMSTKEKVDSMVNCFNQSQMELLSLVNGRGKNQENCYNQLRQGQVLFEQTLLQSVGTMKQLFEQSVRIIRDQVEVHNNELQNLTNLFVDTLSRNTKAMETFTTAHLQVMKDLSQDVQKTSSVHVNQMSSYQISMDELVEQQKQQNHLMKLELMKQVETLLETTIEKQETKLCQSITSFKQFCGQSIDSMKDMEKSVGLHTEKINCSVQDLKQGVENNQQASLKQSQEYNSNLGGAVEKINSETNNLSNKLYNYCDIFNTSINSHTQRVNATIDSDMKEQKEFIDATHDICSNNKTNFMQSQSQFQNAMDTYDNRIKLFSDSQLSQHNQYFEKVQTFTSEFKDSNLNEMKRNIDNFFLNSDNPTGSTPQKKKRKLPERLPRTLPKNELLELYRSSMLPPPPVIKPVENEPQEMEDDSLVSIESSEAEGEKLMEDETNKENLFNSSLSTFAKRDSENFNISGALSPKKVKTVEAKPNQNNKKKPTITKVIKANKNTESIR